MGVKWQVVSSSFIFAIRFLSSMVVNVVFATVLATILVMFYQIFPVERDLIYE